MFLGYKYITITQTKNNMSLLVIGTVAFDAIETPFGKTDKIVGGAATFISMAASYFTKNINLVGCEISPLAYTLFGSVQS